MSTPKRPRHDTTCTRTAAAAPAHKMLNKAERSAVVVNIKSSPDILDKVTKTFQNHAQVQKERISIFHFKSNGTNIVAYFYCPNTYQSNVFFQRIWIQFVNYG